MRPLITIAVLLVANLTHAQVVLDLPAGTHYLKVTVAADGSATAHRIPVVDVDGNSPPPKPDPTGQKTIKELARDLAKNIDDEETAKDLATAFRALSVTVKSGQVQPSEVPDVTVGLLKKLLKDKGHWDIWARAITSKLSSVVTSTDTAVAAFDDIAAGLNESAGSANVDFGKIAELIKLIIEIVKLLREQGAVPETPTLDQSWTFVYRREP